MACGVIRTGVTYLEIVTRKLVGRVLVIVSTSECPFGRWLVCVNPSPQDRQLESVGTR